MWENAVNFELILTFDVEHVDGLDLLDNVLVGHSLDAVEHLRHVGVRARMVPEISHKIRLRFLSLYCMYQ